MTTPQLSGLTERRFETVDELHGALAPIMEAIAAAVGSHCEVVLHDLTGGDLEHTVHAIINGHVSGREVGGPSTNLGVDVLADESAEHNDFGYRARTPDGRQLRSSSVYFRDPAGKIMASLCINVDLTPLQSALRTITSLLPTEGDEAPKEVVGQDIAGVLDTMIDDAVAAVGKTTDAMDKQDRIEVLRSLENRGGFTIKRAADIVARRLGVSRVTVYGYLDEIRRG